MGLWGGAPQEGFVMVLRSKLKYGLAISLALIAPSLGHADVLTLDTWSNASVNGNAISGSFLYDATTNSIVSGSDTTAIGGLCSSGTCHLSEFLPTTLNVGVLPASPPASLINGQAKYLVLVDDLGTPGANPLTVSYANDFTTQFLSFTGGLNITLAPGPTPGEGLLSVALILLMGLSAKFRGLIV